MLGNTPCWRSGFTIPTGEQLDSQVLANRLKQQKRYRFTIKAATATRLQGWVGVAAVLGGAAIFFGPWMVDEYREMLGYKFTAVSPTQMPRTSPQWWENEWRKGYLPWRSGEAVHNFADGPMRFVYEQTGRDLRSADRFRSSAATGSSSHAVRPRVLVPLCGDSPIMKEMVRRGFDVDGVEVSETGLRAAVERSERGLDPVLFPHLRLHWANFLSPDLWNGGPLHKAKFDLIYERQGMTSLNRDQRSDYAFLLKQALKDDGVMYVEGVFRTGRVTGNKLHGPPFSLLKKDLEELFPKQEGFHVRCEEKNDALQQLSRENRLLRRIPKELYTTPFHCAVFRKKGTAVEAWREQW